MRALINYLSVLPSVSFSLYTSLCGFQMVKLRSKLHLSRQGRKSSLSHVFCSAACNAAVPTRPAGTASLLCSPDELPSSSFIPAPTSLGTLPEKLQIRIASFCDLSDILRLRRSSRALYHIFGKSCVIEQVLIHLVSFSFSSQVSFFLPAA